MCLPLNTTQDGLQPTWPTFTFYPDSQFKTNNKYCSTYYFENVWYFATFRTTRQLVIRIEITQCCSFQEIINGYISFPDFRTSKNLFLQDNIDVKYNCIREGTFDTYKILSFQICESELLSHFTAAECKHKERRLLDLHLGGQTLSLNSLKTGHRTLDTCLRLRADLLVRSCVDRNRLTPSHCF